MTAGAAADEAPALPLAVTMGEPAGIGGEITLKAWRRRAQADRPFFAIDDPRRLSRVAAGISMDVPIQSIDHPDQAGDVFSGALPVLPCPLRAEATPGQPDPANAAPVINSIDMAVELSRRGLAAGVVTNPINKQVLTESGFPHPGHTEYLAELCAPGLVPAMMLASADLKVVPVTIHVSLREALDRLSTDGIIEQGLITDAALKSDFAVAAPRLAVAGLNPHAGEGGTMGTEEAEIIGPAVRALRDAGVDATGPHAPDSLFTPQARRTYDAALCMYHDQALIPLKALDFDSGVNITLGLPIVRTSPDHGTAFDIAGTGLANEASLLSALHAATEIAHNRQAAGKHEMAC